jgi:PiT family inorganic phosphate transporter
LFAILLYLLVRRFKRVARIHLIRFESYIKTGLILVGAFGSYSLGANNIANVMGVFIPAFNLNDLDLGLFTLNSAQQLFLLGGLAIAVGIFTYSWKVMDTIGSNILELSSEAAMIVVLAQSMVLFIFSSSALSNLVVRLGLPPIPMVPVSSSQVIVGCIIGIGLLKGARNINFKVLREIGIAWIASPVISGVMTFLMLFFMKNIFNINVGHKSTLPVQGPGVSTDSLLSSGTDMSGVIRYLLIGVLVSGFIAIIYYYLLERKKTGELRKSEEWFWKNLK